MARKLIVVLTSILTICCVPLIGNAQINLEMDSVFVDVPETEFEMVGYNTFTNILPQQTEFKWIRNVVSAPAEWSTFICDSNLCYTSITNESSITLGANGTSLMNVHVEFNGVFQGTALVEVHIELANDPNVFTTAYYEFDPTISSSSQLSITELKIYPNPSSGLFSVEGSTQNLGSLDIFSCSGKLMTSFSINSGDLLDIGNLPNGTYLTVLKDLEGLPIAQKLITKI